MVHLSDLDVETKSKAIVKKTSRFTPDETDEVREILLEVDRPDFKYQVGQSIGVLVKKCKMCITY